MYPVREAAKTLPSSSTCTDALVPSIFSVITTGRNSLGIFGNDSNGGRAIISVRLRREAVDPLAHDGDSRPGTRDAEWLAHAHAGRGRKLGRPLERPEDRGRI